MPDYRNMSSVDALRHAKEKSGMTADEIALKLGTSTAVINRYLRQNDSYSPSLDMIPRLCSALDNTVLIDWLNAQVESPEAVPPAKDLADVLTAVARASAALGNVNRLLVESDNSGGAAGNATGINAGRAREIRSGLEDVKKACTKAQGQLQDLAASDISKHVVLNHICLRETGDRLEFPENRHLESSADLLSESMKPAAFIGGQQEDMHMTASNDFPFGQIENANSSRKTTATLKAVRVSGEIRGLLFTYSIRQEYKNETKQALEVIYTFPVAWHTSLLGMKATIGGKDLAAQVIENNEAETRYEKALSGGDSAIMVQKSAKGLYTANLGNIKAGESVSIELHCAQLLSPQQGRIRVCVPTVISERYGDAHLHGGLAAHESVTTSHDVHYGFSAGIAVMGGMAKYAVICPSHGIKGQALDDGILFAIDGSAQLDRDFVLLIEGVSGVSLAQSASMGEETMLAASFTPILPQHAQSAIGVKILVDCSGSMDGGRIEQAVDGLRQVVRQLTPQDYVSYSLFGSDVRHTVKSMNRCTPDMLKRLEKLIDITSANMGGTNMEEALSSTFALPLPKRSETMPAVLLVTDGDVWAVDSIIKTAKASGQRIFAIGVGDSPAESLLREMTEQTGGACEFVTSSENMAEAIIRMFRRMRGSIAHDIRIDWHGETLWQSALPKFIYDGETVHCFAAMRAVPDTLPHLCWQADGREYSASVERLESASSDDLFRLGKARQMEETENERERKAIALKYQLVSDATSLILVYERAAEDKAYGMPQIEHIRQMPAHREAVADMCCCDYEPLYQMPPAAGSAMASMAPASPRASRISRSMKNTARRPAPDIMMSCECDMSFMMADMDMELPACFRIPALLEELADQFNANSLLFSTVTECLDEILQDSDFAPVKEFLEKLKEKAGEAEGNIPDDETLFAAFMLWVFHSVGIRIDRHAFRLLRNATAKDKDMMKEATRVANGLCEKWLHGDLE